MKYINSKEKWGETPHKEKCAAKISTKGFLRPKIGGTTRKKTTPAGEYVPKDTEFCGSCLLEEMRLKNVITRQPHCNLI